MVVDTCCLYLMLDVTFVLFRFIFVFYAFVEAATLCSIVLAGTFNMPTSYQ